MRSGGRDRPRQISLAATLVGVVALSAGGLTAAAVTGGLPRSLGAPVAGPLATLPAASACATAGACDLYAKPGSATAGSTSVAFWGFTLDDTVASQLAGYVDSTSGIPVNTIIMNTTQTVTLTLHNALPAGNLSLEFPARTGVPDATGAPVGGTATYTLAGLAPGTYVYEAGPTVDQARQLSMGLSGLIIVRPADYVAGTSQSAYGGVDGAFDQEALVVATELDPTFTAAPLANDVDNYTPRAFFLDGKAHPATDDIGVEAGQHVLLHMANLGIRDRALGLVNQRMHLIGDDSTPVRPPTDIATKLLTPGEVSDVTTLVDAAAAIGQQFALLDYGRHLHNSSDNPSLTGALGGMLTFLDVVAIPGPAPAPSGPVAHVSVITPATNDGTGNETVSVTYDGTVSNAYWFVDDITAPNPAHTVGTANGDYVISNSDILSSLPPGGSGDHVIWIQPYNGATVGTPSGAVFTLSLTGPIVGALSIDPAYTNLTTTVNHVGANPAGADPTIAPTDIVVTGSAEPSLVDWTVDAAEICTADPGTASCGGIPLAVGAPTAPSFTYPLSANIAVTAPTIAALSDGPHTLYIHSHELPGAGGGTARWGTSSQIVLTIDRATGPTTTFTTVSPDPAGIADNPGNINFLESVRFNVHLQDAISPIAGAELFLYSSPTAAELGTGSQLRAVGGAWLTGNSMDAYIDVPNAELLSNPQGTINAYVVAQDAAGNWGAPTSYTLRLDKTRPVINSATLTSATRTITVNATDPTGVPPATVPMTSKVVTIEYLINIGAESVGGADDCITGPCLVDVPVTPPADSITQSVVYVDPGVTIIDIQVRVKDGAGNWSDYVKLIP